jgi:hypothetical protein
VDYDQRSDMDYDQKSGVDYERKPGLDCKSDLDYEHRSSLVRTANGNLTWVTNPSWWTTKRSLVGPRTRV